MTKAGLLKSAAAAVLLSATAAQASFVGISVCASQNGGGAYTPGLLTIQNGARSFHPVGENGLTETIIFNAAMAMQWARQTLGFPANTVFGDYVRFICGILVEDEAGERNVETPNGLGHPDRYDPQNGNGPYPGD